jgi:hypothetical protein
MTSLGALRGYVDATDGFQTYFDYSVLNSLIKHFASFDFFQVSLF